MGNCNKPQIVKQETIRIELEKQNTFDLSKQQFQRISKSK